MQTQQTSPLNTHTVRTLLFCTNLSCFHAHTRTHCPAVCCSRCCRLLAPHKYSKYSPLSDKPSLVNSARQRVAANAAAHSHTSRHQQRTAYERSPPARIGRHGHAAHCTHSSHSIREPSTCSSTCAWWWWCASSYPLAAANILRPKRGIKKQKKKSICRS